MSSFLNNFRQGFGRQSSRGNGRGNGTPSPTYQSPTSSLPPSIPPMPHSPALSSTMAENPLSPELQPPPTPRKPPFFFREEYSGLIVKGNFMTLAAKPILVEEGEWLAHQVVEQYRLLEQMINIVKTIDDKTGRPICNQETCPTMSASGHTYTWLDNNKKPIKIPAIQYISLVQKWIIGKINDPNIFPTDTSGHSPAVYPSGGLPATPSSQPIPAGPTNLNAPLSALAGEDWLGRSSGFPKSFEADIRGIYRQMMRCYAHLYHGHWVEPYWHLSSYKELNTCFIHFINVGKLFNLLGDKEMEPMQPLIELWLAKGLLPQQQQAQAQAQVPQQMVKASEGVGTSQIPPGSAS